jgi:cobalt-zinc-cadmium efflux system protein
MAEHTHRSAFSEYLFEYRAVAAKRLGLSLSITLVVMVVEIVGGILVGSIALISDAGHMFTHAFAISISLVAIVIARRPPCHHRTFGLYRAEILAAFINGLILLVVALLVIYEAILRIIHPEIVLGREMLVIALLGLATNLASMAILRGALTDNINIRAVFYHMVADAASSVGIVAAAIVISYTGLSILDPLVSLGISALLVRWSWGILTDSTKVLLEIAPTGLNVDLITDDLERRFPEIDDVYNAHLWTITAGMVVFSAHVVLRELPESTNQEGLIARVNEYLGERYGIIESTIQVGVGGEGEVCELPEATLEAEGAPVASTSSDRS